MNTLSALFIVSLLFEVESYTLPLTYTARIRPGAIFQPPFDKLCVHIYGSIVLNPNNSVESFVMSERDYKYSNYTQLSSEIFVNSQTGYGYFVKNGKCVKTLLKSVYTNCLYVPSYITSQYLLYFMYDESHVRNVEEDITCPAHPNVLCDHWHDTDRNITIFSIRNILETMLLSGILYKPMVYDDFTSSKSNSAYSTPSMKCEEEKDFPLCNFGRDFGVWKPPKQIFEEINFLNYH